MPPSSQASRALSTASLTHVRSAFRGLSKPRRCRFLVKNSETEISRCRAPISAAEAGTGAFGAEGRGSAWTNVISPFDTKSRLAGPPLYIQAPPSGHRPRALATVAPRAAPAPDAPRLAHARAPRTQAPEAIGRLARTEVVQLEELAHLDLGVLARAGGIREALRPGERLLARLHLDDGVAGDQLLRLGEGPVGDDARPARVPDAPAL